MYHPPRQAARLSGRRSPRHSKRQPLKISTALPLQPYHAPPSGMSGSYSSYSRHPTRRSHRPRPPVSSLTYSRHPTAAQSIAVQYRYRLGQETRRERTVRQSPVSPISATATLCSSEHSGFMARMEPRPRMTYSCIVALDHASREAYAMMLRGHDIRNIMCTRPGCGKVLSDLRALTTHIHIHNLDAMDYQEPTARRVLTPRHATNDWSVRRRRPTRSRWHKTFLDLLSRILPSRH